MTCSAPRLRTLEAPPRLRTLEAPPRFVICAPIYVPPAGSTYELAFVSGDLVAGVITATHALSCLAPAVAVYDGSNPANRHDAPIYRASANAVEADLAWAPVGATQWHIGVAAGFVQAFTNVDLVAGILTVAHALDCLAPVVVLYDSTGNQRIAPVTRIDANTVTLDLSAETVTGTWHAGVVEGYVGSFTNADLVAGILTVTHSRNRLAPSVVVYDNASPANRYIMPTTVVSANVCTVDLSSLGAISGTWRVGVV